VDFQFTPKQQAFRSELITFLESQLPPNWEGQEAEGSTDKEWDFTLHMRKKLAEKGWLAMHWPEEFGGSDASPIDQLIFKEEMTYHRVPGPDPMAVKNMGSTLLVFGTEEQKRRFLPPVARGEVQWCTGYSEPNSGSDLASLQTSAVEDGDDFIVNGEKIWSSMAHRANWMLLLARTDPESPKHRGISFLLLDMESPGVTVQPILNMAGNHGFNQVFFEDVRVPKKNLVGELNRGWYVAATLLDFERSGIEYSASSRRTLHDLVRFAKETQWNGTILASEPLVRSRLASLAIEAEVGRTLAYRIAWLQSQGDVPNREASTGKLFGTELQQRVALVGMQLLGLYGQLTSTSKWAPLQGRIEHNYRSSFSTTIASGTSEIQRNIIATRGLGLPRE
jgi:alkylation response protein AidB-like acyl-CoA dehydrogenase